MKMKNLFLLALMGLTCGLSANEQAVAAKKEVVTQANAEEDAFVAQLNEANRKAFAQFTAEQKKSAVALSSCKGSCSSAAKLSANDAVQKVAKEGLTAMADKQAPKATPAAPAPQAK